MNILDLAQSTLTLIGVLVTAIATVLLWRVTYTLAVETRRMAAAAAQPQVVVTIEPNAWSSIHADLRVANHGNASAFDIHVSFDPPLETSRDNNAFPGMLPFQNISLLRPDQAMTSWVGRFHPMIDKSYTVSVSWRRAPGKERETLSYRLSVSDYKNTPTLGSGDPLVEIARRMRTLQENVHKVFAGSQKINVNAFDQRDRDEHERAMQAIWSEEAMPSLSQDTEPS